MASSLATHQFAGVNAQFKCVRARRRRGDFRENSLPSESAATRATFLPEGPTGTRAARPRAASPRARDSRDEWLTTPAPLFRRSAVARKNVKAARNVQVRNETRKIPSRSRNRANVQSRRFKARAPGTRPGGTRDRRAAPQTPRGVRAIPHHRARRPPTPAGRPARPRRAAPPVSRLDTRRWFRPPRAPVARQRKNATDNSPMLPPFVLFSILADPRGGTLHRQDVAPHEDRLHLHRGCPLVQDRRSR